MFEFFEKSRFLGKPVQLFVFKHQNTVVRFANGDHDVTIGAITYLAGGDIEHSEIKETAERAKDKITIKMAHLRDPNALATEIPPTQALGRWWYPFPPGDPVEVTCLLHHYGDADPPAVEWIGVATQPDYTDVELTLTCEPTNGFARAHGQGPLCSRACWKLVYSTGIRGCNLDPEDFKAEGALTSVAGLVLQAAAFGASAFNLAGGWASWTDPVTGLKQRCSITAHTGNAITIAYAAPGLAPGRVVAALPTCPRTWAGCAERREDPQNHFGGNFYKPVENPDGESMSWG